MKDTFLSFLIVAVIALIIGYKLFTGIMNTNEAMIAEQEIAAANTEATTNSITETTTKKHRETTTETTTNEFELIKYDAQSNLGSRSVYIKNAFDELLAAADSGDLEIYRVANNIIRDRGLRPDAKYKEIAGTYYELVNTCYVQLFTAAQDIVDYYDNTDNKGKNLLNIQDTLTSLKYGLSLIDQTRLEWLQNSGLFTDEEINYLK